MPANKIKCLPIYYKQIFKRWSENLSSSPSLPSAIASQVIWYNKCIKVDNKTLYNFKMSRKDILTLDSFSNATVNLNYGKN